MGSLRHREPVLSSRTVGNRGRLVHHLNQKKKRRGWRRRHRRRRRRSQRRRRRWRWRLRQKEAEWCTRELFSVFRLHEFRVTRAPAENFSPPLPEGLWFVNPLPFPPSPSSAIYNLPNWIQRRALHFRTACPPFLILPATCDIRSRPTTRDFNRRDANWNAPRLYSTYFSLSRPCRAKRGASRFVPLLVKNISNPHIFEARSQRISTLLTFPTSRRFVVCC